MNKRPHRFDEKRHTQLMQRIARASAAAWKHREKKTILSLFADAAKQVPAYKKFLAWIELSPHNIHTIADMTEKVPATSKHNYIRAYPRNELLWKGAIQAPIIFTATSGSTGKPTYFMRTPNTDYQASIIHEQFYLQSCNPKKPTLVIVCFGMGIWVGGLITYNAFQKTADRGPYPISIITPGVNMKEALRALREVAPQYEQVIMCGYPPFIKDVLDAAQADGIGIDTMGLKFVFAAESFTDVFRMHIAKRAGAHPYRDITNIFGTAELGAMAWETPIAGLVRHIATEHKNVFTALFGNTTRTPTLAQYIPDFCAFTENNGELFAHSDSAMPLVQYALGDKGGVLAFDELEKRLLQEGVDIHKEAKKQGIQKTLYELPFVFVHERIDLVVTLYGLNVFPQPIKEALLHKNFEAICTGKCVLETVCDEDQNQYLVIHTELTTQTKKVPQETAAALQHHVAAQLREKNAEYKELSAHLGERALPKMVFWENGNKQYFAQGIKQRWVVTNKK